MTIRRLLRIAIALGGLAAAAAWDRLRGRDLEVRFPGLIRKTLEDLGPTCVKIGQALSLRRDILPEPYVEALRGLQDHVGPFSGEDAVREIERAFGQPIDRLFSEFDRKPMAAASIAQVHRARRPDGRAVIVKVRRPGIRAQIEQDMQALSLVLRVVLRFRPALEQYRPLRLLEEIGANLRKETDFRQEAQSIVRFQEAFRDWSTINVPGVVDGLARDAVLVQEMSQGRSIDDPAVRADGPRLAQVFTDAYLHQFFVIGLFHGDPHPGNLFVMEDGRLCFHDFGLVGFLDWNTRRALAMFLKAFVNQDAAWTLDAAIDLGILNGMIDRPEFVRGIDAILADYAALPLKDWSLAEAFLRVMRLGEGRSIRIPHNLLVLLRALFLVENALRTLDPEFNVLETLIAKGEQAVAALLQERAGGAVTARLKHEAAVTLQELPALVGAWLHKATHEGGQIAFTLHHDGLEKLEQHLDRSSNRMSLALVTLGLYIAASLLMQHSIGPRLFGDMPLLAAIGYALALWFTFRIASGISRSGRL